MRVKAPFWIEYRRKGAIQFLRSATGEYLGQFNTYTRNGKVRRTGTFTSFLPRPIKYLGRFCYNCYDESQLTPYGALRILSKVFQHLYKDEPVSAGQTQALMCISGLQVDIEQELK